MFRKRLAALYLLFIFPVIVPAQPAVLSVQAEISLITILPGEAPEELFGHSAVRVHDPQQNLDLLFNYGTFEFGSNFLPKFIYGDLSYFLSIAGYPRAIDIYRDRRRPVIKQVFNLSARQKQALYDFLKENAREENRYYRYDFLFDNCSTRIREVLQVVLGDDLRFAPEPDPSLSFRRLLDPYLEAKPLLDFGIDLLLGSPVDQTAGPEQVMFLPDFLMEAFEHASVRIDGEYRPLVANTETVLQIDGYGKENRGLPLAAALFWGLFILGLWITWKNIDHRQPAERWLDIPLFGLAGFTGLLIAFLWFLSLHDVTAGNWNLIWAWPTHMITVFVLFRRQPPGRFVKGYLLLSALTASAGLIFLIIQPQLQFIHPAAIPLVLLLILRSWRIADIHHLSPEKPAARQSP